MARFSIESALKSGFRLARREWKTVLVWGLAYSIFSIVVQLISIGGALPQYLELAGGDPEAAAAALQRATGAQSLVTVPIVMILSLLGMAVFYAAIARAILRPGDRGFFYLRFGRSELWLLLTVVALAVLAGVAIIPLVIVVSVVVGVLAGGSGTTAVLLGVVLGAAAVVGYLYLAARLSPAWVQAFDEQRFVLADAWRLTRGQGWRIVLMMLALVFLVLILCVAAIIPAAILVGVVVAALAATGEAAMGVIAILPLLVGFVLFVAFSGLIYTVMLAPYVEVYRELKGATLPGGETAEVFA